MLKDGPGAPERGIEIIFTDCSAAGVVTEGAIVWFANHDASPRARRFAYGTETLVEYDPNSSEHQDRKRRQTHDGATIKGGWSQIIAKDIVLDGQQEITKTYYRMFASANPQLSLIEETIYTYDGPEAKPMFMYNKAEELDSHFRMVCVLRADLTGKQGALVEASSKNGTYWRLPFQIALTFRRTELCAAIQWKENGQIHRGPVVTVPLDSA